MCALSQLPQSLPLSLQHYWYRCHHEKERQDRGHADRFGADASAAHIHRSDPPSNARSERMRDSSIKHAEERVSRGPSATTMDRITDAVPKEIGQGQKPHSYLLMLLTRRSYRERDQSAEDQSHAANDSKDIGAQEDSNAYVIAPVSRQAVTDALRWRNKFTARTLLSKLF